MVRTGKNISRVRLAAFLLICRAKRPIVLEAEVARKGINRFMESYSSWTGVTSNWDDLVKKHYVIDCGAGKWGTECRIYFKKDPSIRRQLERYAYMVEKGDVRHRGTFRINNNDLFKEFVKEHGFTLGPND